MKNQLGIILFSLLLLFSCKSQLKKQNTTAVQQQWFSPLYWISDQYQLYNFPYWFNSELISENKVSQITIRYYSLNYTDTNNVQPNNKQPNYVYHYDFDKKGQITTISYEEFRDGFSISSFRLLYDSTNISEDFRRVNENQKYFFSLDSIINFNSFEITNQNENYVQYINSHDNQSIYLIKKASLLNPMSIDTMITPQPNDIIAYPNLRKPIKIYSVKNIIIESPVNYFKYDSKGNLTSISRRIKSNTVKKIFNFDSKGVLNGFEKYVYDENVKIRSTKYTIQTDVLNRPIKIYEDSNSDRLKELITISYK